MAKTNTTRKASTQKATQKKVIAEAVRTKDTTNSDFVLEQSLTAAQHVIADQVHFSLPKKKWRSSVTRLIRRQNDPCTLRKLLSKPGYLMPTAENFIRWYVTMTMTVSPSTVASKSRNFKPRMVQ